MSGVRVPSCFRFYLCDSANHRLRRPLASLGLPETCPGTLVGYAACWQSSIFWAHDRGIGLKLSIDVSHLTEVFCSRAAPSLIVSISQGQICLTGVKEAYSGVYGSA